MDRLTRLRFMFVSTRLDLVSGDFHHGSSASTRRVKNAKDLLGPVLVHDYAHPRMIASLLLAELRGLCTTSHARRKGVLANMTRHEHPPPRAPLAASALTRHLQDHERQRGPMQHLFLPFLTDTTPLPCTRQGGPRPLPRANDQAQEDGRRWRRRCCPTHGPPRQPHDDEPSRAHLPPLDRRHTPPARNANRSTRQTLSEGHPTI